jgi:hypothetical protein
VRGNSSVEVEFIPAPEADPLESNLIASLRSGLGASDVNVRRVPRIRAERSMKFPLTGRLP